MSLINDFREALKLLLSESQTDHLTGLSLLQTTISQLEKKEHLYDWIDDARSASVKRDVRHLVNRFLGWKLPSDFSPDCGITFVPPKDPNWGPVGTNLLTADQAKAMFEYCLEGCGYVIYPLKPEARQMDGISDS